MNKAKILPCDEQGRLFNVQIWTKPETAPGGYVYCGNGKFCKNITEVVETCEKYNVVEREYPELVGIIDNYYDDVDEASYLEVLVAPDMSVTVKHRPEMGYYVMDGEGGEIHETANYENGHGNLSPKETAEVILLVSGLLR